MTDTANTAVADTDEEGTLILTRRTLEAALQKIGMDDPVRIGLVKPSDDENDAGFVEGEDKEVAASKSDDDEEDAEYMECAIREAQIVPDEESGGHALILFVDPEMDLNEVDDEGEGDDGDSDEDKEPA